MINLIGPVSYTEMYSRELDKVVYLYGDYHMKSEICSTDGRNTLTIVDLIDQTVDEFKRQGEYLDVFLEVAFKKNVIEGGMMGWLNDIYEKYKDCMQIDKRDCEHLPYCRFHTADLRSYDPYTNLFMTNIFYPESSEKFFQRGEIYRISSKSIFTGPEEQRDMDIDALAADLETLPLDRSRAESQSDLSPVSRATIANIFIDNIKKFLNNEELVGLINKQFAKIEDEGLRSRLGKLCRDYIQLMHSQAPDMDKALKRLKEPYVLVNFKSYYNYVFDNKYYILQSLIAFVGMDLYLIGRLFKSYVRNAIVYSGEAHNNIYRQTLKLLGFVEVNRVERYKQESGFQCLPIDNTYGMFNRDYLRLYRPSKKRSADDEVDLDEGFHVPKWQRLPEKISS